MSKRLLIYGASGYTGRLLAREAQRLGLDPVLCGRNMQKLQACAAQLGGLSLRCASLDDANALHAMLRDAHALLNAAGPFSTTVDSLVDACIDAGVHYLDVSGEVVAIERVSARHAAARKRRVMLMPGVGFDVVPSDCLSAHVLRRVARPRRLDIGISGQKLITRGSALTMVDQLADPVLIRRAGVLRRVPPASIERRFDFGRGPRSALAVSWGDVASAYYSTGIRDITTYFEGTAAVHIHNSLLRMFGWTVPYTPWQRILQAGLEFMPEGPSERERLRHRTQILAEITDENGRTHASRLHAPEAYSFTARTGAEIAKRVMNGDFEVGFETPARVYGPDFVLGFDGVVREDIS